MALFSVVQSIMVSSSSVETGDTEEMNHLFVSPHHPHQHHHHQHFKEVEDNAWMREGSMAWTLTYQQEAVGLIDRGGWMDPGSPIWALPSVKEREEKIEMAEEEKEEDGGWKGG